MNRCSDDNPFKTSVCPRPESGAGNFGNGVVVSSPMRTHSFATATSTSYNSVNSTTSPGHYDWTPHSVQGHGDQDSGLRISSVSGSDHVTDSVPCDSSYTPTKRRDNRLFQRQSESPGDYVSVTPSKPLNCQSQDTGNVFHPSIMSEHVNKKASMYAEETDSSESTIISQHHVHGRNGGMRQEVNGDCGNGNGSQPGSRGGYGSDSPQDPLNNPGQLDSNGDQVDSYSQCNIIEKSMVGSENELKRLLTSENSNGQMLRNATGYDSNNNGNGNYMAGMGNPYADHHQEEGHGSMMRYGSEGNEVDHSEGNMKQGYWASPGFEQQENSLDDSGNQVHRSHQHSPDEPMNEEEDESINVVKFNLWNGNNGDLPIYPSGLEVLWREIPEDCQTMITPQDVPEPARFRGYFTVCELITLKKNLLTRQTDRRDGIISSNCKTGHPTAMGGDGVNGGMCPNLGLGSAFKEAMNTLNPEELQEHQQVTINQSLSFGRPPGINCMDSKYSASMTMDIVPSQQQQAMMNAYGGVNRHGERFKEKVELLKGLTVPPPPYRTSTLVFKLLEIGSYHFRSFSDSNPNRLRVLFNTQRLSYECQLPVVPPGVDSSQPLRKILTIEVNFDQISVMKFGSDKMFLRVEGPPVLNVTYSPSNEEPYPKNLSTEDQFLLDQIDRGQLKLSPNHHLYFINERLVHVLENQFREHPRFRHLLAASDVNPHGPR